MFRFPKRAEVERQLLVETRILPLLAECSPIPLPRFHFQGRPSATFPRRFAGYARLAGIPAIALDPAQIRFLKLVPALGRFLSFLHSFPVSTATQVSVPEYSSADQIAEARTEALRDLHVVRQVMPDAPEAAWRAYLEAGVDAARPGAVPPVLVHCDLAAEHILLDSETHQVTGIIDWGDVAVADPAIDFAGIFHWGGANFAKAALASYHREADNGLLERARFFGACRGIADIVFGLEAQRPEYIAGGVRALTMCVGR